MMTVKVIQILIMVQNERTPSNQIAQVAGVLLNSLVSFFREKFSSTSTLAGTGSKK